MPTVIISRAISKRVDREQEDAADDSSGFSEGGSSAAHRCRGDYGQAAPHPGSTVHWRLLGRVLVQGAHPGENAGGRPASDVGSVYARSYLPQSRSSP